MVDQRRWKLAQQREKEYWEHDWKGCRRRIDRAEEYWDSYLDLFKKEICFQHDSRVLDIGCGPCGIINYIKEGERHGLDPLIDFYVSNFPMPREIIWTKGEGENIPFKTGCFDLVFATNTLDHTRVPERCLQEIHRVLRQGGFLILTINTYSLPRVVARRNAERRGKGDIAHPHAYTAGQVRKMLRKAGFKLVSSTRGSGDLGVATVDVGTRKSAARSRTLPAKPMELIAHSIGALVTKSWYFVNLRLFGKGYQGDRIFTAMKY